MNLHNNLFTYATSELSQDAFLCWLLSFAMADAQDCAGLRSCAETFLVTAIPELAGAAHIFVEDISRQMASIDILITINGQYKLIIEDKTDTHEHSDQLSRYLSQVSQRFPQYMVRGVYYKTGFQSDYSAVREAGYTIIDRRQMLAIMNPLAEQIVNNIWQDYYAFLANFEQEAEQFRTLPINQWEWRQINAFYDDLKLSGFLTNRGISGDYGYVSNPAGGFYGMWFGKWEPIVVLEVSCELYLQLQFIEHELHICLKLSVDQDTLIRPQITGRMLRDRIVYGSKGTYWLERYGFIRPIRFGSGRTMTLGEFGTRPISSEEAYQALQAAISAYLCILQEIGAY